MQFCIPGESRARKIRLFVSNGVGIKMFKIILVRVFLIYFSMSLFFPTRSFRLIWPVHFINDADPKVHVHVNYEQQAPFTGKHKECLQSLADNASFDSSKFPN